MYNQCANEILRYAIKQREGVLRTEDVPRTIQGEVLPAPPKPEDVDCIVTGFPWWVLTSRRSSAPLSLHFCSQPHSALNRFQKANDVKSNLILNLLSWVDFLKPKYCVFENVRGFMHFNLKSYQVDEHRVAGGIPMGGLKFVVHAMVAMK